MSFAAMAWANSQKTGSSARSRLLIAIASYCDEEALCWPSRQRLADNAELSLSSVNRHLAALQDQGLLSLAETGRRPDGGLRMQIRLHLDQRRVEACLRKHRAPAPAGVAEGASAAGQSSPPDACPPADQAAGVVADARPGELPASLDRGHVNLTGPAPAGQVNLEARSVQFERQVMSNRASGHVKLTGPLYTDEPIIEPIKEPVTEPDVCARGDLFGGIGLSRSSAADPGSSAGAGAAAPGAPRLPSAAEAAAPNAPAEPPGFDRFWAAYPHKVSRAHAKAAFARALRKPLVTLGVLLDGVARYERTKPPERQWCNPATWLNGERWLDAPAPVAAGPPDAMRNPFAVLGDELRRRLDA